MWLRDEWSCNPLCSLERTDTLGFFFSPPSSKKDRTRRYQQFCFGVLLLHRNLSKRHDIYDLSVLWLQSCDNSTQLQRQFQAIWQKCDVYFHVTFALPPDAHCCDRRAANKFCLFPWEFTLTAPFDQIECNLTWMRQPHCLLRLLKPAEYNNRKELLSPVIISLDFASWICLAESAARTHTRARARAHSPRIASTEQTYTTNVKCCRIARRTE